MSNLTDAKKEFSAIFAIAYGFFAIFLGNSWSNIVGLVESSNPQLICLENCFDFTYQDIFIFGSPFFIILWIFYIVDIFYKITIKPSGRPFPYAWELFKKSFAFLMISIVLFGLPIMITDSISYFVNSIAFVIGFLVILLYFGCLIFDMVE